VTSLPIRRATLDDVADMTALWVTASSWLATIGTDQWQYPVRVEGIRAEVAAGDAWVVRADDGRLIGMVTLEDSDHSGLWTDGPESAFYVHRLVVDRATEPADLGSAILDWAGRQAQHAGRGSLRLDAWTTNTGLHRYYLGRGFRHVRTIDAPDVQSGALFERAADVQIGRGPYLYRNS
jgi:ribosomal protein S18 acetylase RimI-like enzyme